MKTSYKNYQLHHVEIADAFSVFYSWGNMSNGESVGTLYVFVGKDKYAGWGWKGTQGSWCNYELPGLS